MHSIRTYLVIVILSSICIANFIAALQGYRSGMEYSDRMLDQRLLEAHDQLVRFVGQHQPIPENLFGPDKIFQVAGAQGVQWHSANATAVLALPSGGGFHLLSYNDQRWRVFVSQRGLHTLLVGERDDLYRDMMEQMILRTALPILWVLPVLGLLLWLIIWWGLKPLKNLAQTLANRSPSELDAIAPDDYPVELSTVVHSTNQLFLRLDEAFARERRFSADAAHELRTPLASLKVGLHNLALEHRLDNADSFADVCVSVDAMAHSIEQLLALYSMSPEETRRHRETVDLTATVQQVIVEQYDWINARGQQIGLDSARPALMQGNPFALEMLVRNLIDNACKYSPPGGQIMVHLEHQSDAVQLRIEDSGNGIEPALRERVFDRFFRAGSVKNISEIKGSGLGLSIVRLVADLHDARVRLGQSEPLGGLSVTVLFPLN